MQLPAATTKTACSHQQQQQKQRTTTSSKNKNSMMQSTAAAWCRQQQQCRWQQANTNAAHSSAPMLLTAAQRRAPTKAAWPCQQQQQHHDAHNSNATKKPHQPTKRRMTGCAMALHTVAFFKTPVNAAAWCALSRTLQHDIKHDQNLGSLCSKKENAARQQVTQPNAAARPASRLHAAAERRMQPENAQD